MRASHMAHALIGHETTQVDVLKKLLSAGVDINQVDNHGNNALFYACYQFFQDGLFRLGRKQREVIDLLIESGIDIHHRNNQNETVVHEILSDTFEVDFDSDTIIYLIEKGFDYKTHLDQYGRTLSELVIKVINENYNNADINKSGKLVSFLEQRELNFAINEVDHTSVSEFKF